MPLDDSIGGEVTISEKEEQVRTQFDKCLRDARQSVERSMQKLAKLDDELLERVKAILEQTESMANSYVKEG
jgi:heptaprenyl diphosphate synthase